MPDHDHHAMAGHTGLAGMASLAAIVGKYDNATFLGDYEGTLATAMLTYEGFGGGVMVPLYRLVANGKETYGAGDVMLHAVAPIVDAPVTLGASVAVMLPTGNDRVGLGMGHVMVMPALTASYPFGRLRALATVTYAHGFVDAAEHQHGGPLVEPMNLDEVALAAGLELGGEFDGAPVTLTARLGGAIPTTDEGDGRAFGAVGGRWLPGRFGFGAEVQLGIAGDPFLARGVVDATVSF